MKLLNNIIIFNNTQSKALINGNLALEPISKIEEFDVECKEYIAPKIKKRFIKKQIQK